MFSSVLTLHQPPSVAEFENISALTYRLAPAAQREPIGEQDNLHYPSIHTSLSENQEMPRWLAGFRLKSDQTDAILLLCGQH
jgi:hypothetical protein